MYCSVPVSKLSSHRLTIEECRILVDLITSNSAPENLPGGVKSFLMEVKACVAVKGKEKAAGRILKKLNGRNRKRSVFIRTWLLRHFYDAMQERKKKPPASGKMICLPSGIKVHVSTYEIPFFNFRDNIPVREVRVNYRKKTVHLEIIGVGSYSYYSRRVHQTQNTEGNIFVVQFERLIGIFPEYHINNYYRNRYSGIRSKGSYWRIYGIFVTFTDFKNIEDRKNARYVMFRFKRNAPGSEPEKSETLGEILNLLGKDRKIVKDFLKRAGHSLKSRVLARKVEGIPPVPGL